MLTWNLFHGRAVPGAGRDLLAAFSGRLASWDWDVALLQEVPPWWAGPLARACEADHSCALTSRNALLPARRALARRWPDAMKSNGGGANAILSRRGLGRVRAVRLRTWPERRVAQIASVGGIWVANYHASTTPALAREETARLWALLDECAGEEPVVAGGDLNLRDPRGPEGAEHVAARDVDHLFARGVRPAAPAQVLDHRFEAGTGELSDHPPLLARLVLPLASTAVGTL